MDDLWERSIPFYDANYVGSCQDKGYDHCGQCPDIPCDKFYELL